MNKVELRKEAHEVYDFQTKMGAEMDRDSFVTGYCLAIEINLTEQEEIEELRACLKELTERVDRGTAYGSRARNKASIAYYLISWNLTPHLAFHRLAAPGAPKQKYGNSIRSSTQRHRCPNLWQCL